MATSRAFIASGRLRRPSPRPPARSWRTGAGCPLGGGDRWGHGPHHSYVDVPHQSGGHDIRHDQPAGSPADPLAGAPRSRRCCAGSARRSSATTRSCTAPTAPAGSRTRTTPPPAGPWTSSRTSSATRSCRGTPTRTPSHRHRPADDPSARGRPSDHPLSRRRRRRHRRDLHGLGLHGRHRQGWSACWGCGSPPSLEDRFHLSASHPRRPATGGLHRPLRAPQQRGSSGASAWPTSSPRTTTATSTASGCGRLERHADRPLKIGSFSAASNVTGIVSDTNAIATLLHEHGALSFWDFAAAGPYVDIEMYGSPGAGPAAYKDAIFLSPHKFIGGPPPRVSSSSVARLATNRVPDVPGGGTVAFVNPSEHRYLDDPAHREEGGTPAIIESIRAGLVFQLKQAVGVQTIREREEHFLRRAVASWQQEPAIEILGNLDAERLSIVSFVIHAPEERAASCTTTSSSRSSTTCSGSSPAAAVPARGPTATTSSASTSSAATSSRRSARLRGHQARLGTRELQLLHLRARLQLHRRRRAPRGPRRLAAARGLPLRPGDRALAPPARAGRAAAAPCRSGTTRTAGSPPANTSARRSPRSRTTSVRAKPLQAASPCDGTVPSQPISTTCAGSSAPASLSGP